MRSVFQLMISFFDFLIAAFPVTFTYSIFHAHYLL